MNRKNSDYKMIFEDSSLSDLQKYIKITNLYNKRSRFWTIIIGLNAIILPLLFIAPNVKIDNSNLSPIVVFKH